jgi:hypothetical protein
MPDSDNNTNKLVLVKFENVFGRELIYPDNESAELFCKIADTKSLTHEMIRYIKQLGYSVETRQQKRSL